MIACVRPLERIDVVVFIGIVFDADFIIETRKHGSLEVEHTACVVHQVIAPTNQPHPVQPHRLGLRHHRDKATIGVERIALLLPAHAVECPCKMPHFVGSHHASHLRISASKIAAHTSHHTQRCAAHASKAHRSIHPGQVAQMQKVMRRFHAEINLVHFAQRRRRLVAGTAAHIRKKRIDIDTVGKPPLYREAKFLIHLRSAIAHGHLNRLVAMRFQGIAPRCRIRIYNK